MSIISEFYIMFVISLLCCLFFTWVYIHKLWRHISCLRCGHRYLVIRNHNVFPVLNPINPAENLEEWHTVCPRCKSDFYVEWRGNVDDIPRLWYRSNKTG